MLIKSTLLAITLLYSSVHYSTAQSFSGSGSSSTGNNVSNSNNNSSEPAICALYIINENGNIIYPPGM